MASGITAIIAENKEVTGAEFLLRCAKQFGALYHMRDERLDAEPELRKADIEHYDKTIARYQKELHELENTTLAEAAVAVDAEFNKELEYNKKRLLKMTELRDRYAAMRDKVEAWEPPTAEHENLKNFAIQQLTESIAWDCDFTSIKVLEVQDPQQWLDTRIAQVKESIKWYQQQKEKEIERVNESNQWVIDLLASLKEIE